MAAVPIIIMAASAAMAAYGSIKSAQAQSASYKSQANAAAYNAEADRQNANAAEGAASANEMAERRQNDQRLGAMRASVAASGGGFSGTNINALNQAETNMDLDALNTRYQGYAQAHGLLSNANLQDLQQKNAMNNASTSMQAGYIGAASQALGSASNYYNYRSLSTGG